MECNKAEALRAKKMAEMKMESKDFLRARKIAIQAQKLYPELENISQLIMVCDVHCSAENKVHGTEMDWYGILKVEPTADDLLIRIQSRKFGLFLHPDKNKCPGAADAFKLIGEAQSVLLDQGKRWIHDMKCISAAVNGAPDQEDRPSNVERSPGHEKGSQFQQALQTYLTGSDSSKPTFWTACSFCSIRYQYHRDMLDKSIKCQTCGKSFVGNDISTPGVASHNSWSLLPVPSQAPAKVDQQSNDENSMTIKVGDTTWSSEAPQGSKPNEKCDNVSMYCNHKRKAVIPQLCGKMNEKKRKQVSESSKSCNSEASKKSEEVCGKGGGFNGEPFPTRSSRPKRDVYLSCNKNYDINIVEPANNCRDFSQSTRVAVTTEQLRPVMEGYKEEAFRAKGIAEEKMENKDFLGARKMAIKAQYLYPELENISQLMMVCDVHCSAETKVYETEMDWYGILNVEPTADDVLIKKQFRKFTLLLHRAKNKFAGAADALKLIEEAQRVLLDQGKRRIHDMKRKQFCTSRPTFWTACPFCFMRYQYYRDVLHQDLCCQICEKTFTAYEVGDQASPQISWNQSLVPFSKEGLQNTGYVPKIESENRKPSEDAVTAPGVYEYPDPDFSDFGKNWEENCFAAGQIWAIYDTKDAMPRFYAQVTEVLHPKFKLRITWLEADPENKDEISWVEEDLPVSCGTFTLGSSENTEDRLIFSHLVSCEKGNTRDSYSIYPRKGETWALFKNWDITWSLNPDNERKYEYEFVEVLSDYTNGNSISVAYLGKVRGYVCLFCRTKQEGVDIFEIKTTEIFRFSHKIPSFRMTGKERKGMPIESFELDPACLPTNLLDEEDQMLRIDVSHNISGNLIEDAGAAQDPREEAYEIPDPEFYNFDVDKSIEKFEIGQVWALYSDEDGLPKYYGLIKKIDRLPEYKLHVAWMGVGSTPNDMIQWIDRKMLVTCGSFKVIRLITNKYTSTASFSHQVRAGVESRGEKEEYVILPRTGEIWAIYKNWNAGLKCSDLENCDYDIVEVVEESQSDISVLSLEEAEGFKSVFRVQVKGQCPVMFKIPVNEVLRFSHQIPAFRLTEERGGSLRGYLELDPAALPFYLFCSKRP